VVEALLGGPQRFNDLPGQIPGIAPAEAPRHPACGTLLEARWYCPTRDHLVDHEPRDAEVSYL